jgi:ABC-type sugar transport system ATPase subunit
MQDISKAFPGVLALSDMQLEVRRGEVHAVVGENGAGKSTLMHILAGVHHPDEGRIAFANQDNVRIADERAAQKLGIAIVYQERSLFDSLTIAENIFAGRQPVRFGNCIDRRRMEQDAGRLLSQVGLLVHSRTLLKELSPAQQQLVEIAKALSFDASLIIFDEPTAALTETETKTLFAVIDALRTAGTAVIYISHRLEEVFQIADRVTVLKDGRWQGTLPIKETTPQQLIKRMVGRDVAGTLRVPSPAAAAPQMPPATALEVRQLSDLQQYQRRGGSPVLQDISFHVHSGEIVALAGLAGAGRTETALAIFGARPHTGKIFVAGRQSHLDSVAQAIAAGIGYLPEDRKQAGLFLDMSIAQNMVAANLKKFGRIVTSHSAILRTAADYRQRLGIASRGIHQSVRSLSGGNQQKVLLAKWLLVEPRVLIVDEPTRGVDVAAKAEVHRLLVELADRGTAILMISSELTEILALADRILVMSQGRLTGELARGEATEERVIHLASRS